MKMHIIQERLLELSRKQNLANLTLREMAQKIGEKDISPQKIKHHLIQLEKKGFLSLNRTQGAMNRRSLESRISEGLLKNNSKLFSIPIIGTANCGAAEIFAEQNFQGFLRISQLLLKKSNPNGLFAIKADGYSMNRATIGGKKIEDGDYVIVDSKNLNPNTNDVVLVIIDNNATIKRFMKDEINEQIILKADSSYDYEPIYLHPQDDFYINGKIIDVIKK
jgi:SOS-response transcriptional repressor LexA